MPRVIVTLCVTLIIRQRVYHAKCAGLLRVPKGAFICPAHEPPSQPSINIADRLPINATIKPKIATVGISTHAASAVNGTPTSGPHVGQQALSSALGVNAETVENVSAAHWERCDVLGVTFAQLIKSGMPVVSVEGCS